MIESITIGDFTYPFPKLVTGIVDQSTNLLLSIARSSNTLYYYSTDRILPPERGVIHDPYTSKQVLDKFRLIQQRYPLQVMKYLPADVKTYNKHLKQLPTDHSLWLQDLLFRIVHQGGKPETAEGTVFIEHLDMLLTPKQQSKVVGIMKRAFPKIQFIFTSLSPLVLGCLSETEVIIPTETGFRRPKEDWRLLTVGEILNLEFDIDDVHPNEEFRLLREYVYLAANPYRSKADDQKLDRWEKKLNAAGVEFDSERIPKEKW